MARSSGARLDERTNHTKVQSPVSSKAWEQALPCKANCQLDVKRLTTLSSRREQGLLKSPEGSDPQKVIDPTENTAPPPGQSK
ncbi:MAG: hypothetical protein EBX70_12065 [Betaproteobacteria bacterium]|nr:hypothetical protein [Betaproteobacteria bacterium]